jgi:dimethylglycine dehydrogenase
VKPEFSHIGGEVDVRILGETRRAVVIADSPYDPGNKTLRA